MQAPDLSWGWENEEWLWHLATIYKNTHLDIFKAQEKKKKVLFFPEALRENVHDYHLSKKKNGERKREEKRNTAELTPRNSPFYSAQLNFINHRKSEMKKTY